MNIKDFADTVDLTQKPTVASPIKPVVRIDVNTKGTIKMNLTIRHIMAIADFAGLVIDENKSFSKEDKDSFMGTEFTIEDDVEVTRDGKIFYKGKTVCCTEYPEEGYLPLDY